VPALPVMLKHRQQHRCFIVQDDSTVGAGACGGLHAPGPDDIPVT
jgi:hypothetical protein